MTIGMGDLAVGFLLAGFSALAWCRRRNVGGKTWAFGDSLDGMTLIGEIDARGSFRSSR